ncbi:MAG: hypothetical protein HC797_09155 [Anaerolineales bacterium]|nr:hypothetical protein [Anaerolineales bacterium]
MLVISRMNPRFLLTLGVILMFGGILLPFLMVIKLIETTFFLNFLAWGISTLGLALGTVGFALMNRRQS